MHKRADVSEDNVVVTANIMAGNSNLKRTITPGERMLSDSVLI